jgi:hypothetical protein
MYIKTLLPIIFLGVFFVATQTNASTSNWQKGFSIIPMNQTDFNSESFRQSLRNLQGIGANYVTLIIPYYQDTIDSTAMYPGSDTPNDESLNTAIVYAHSIGMKVNLNIHLEARNDQWRAHINPSDRNTWFTNYGLVLNHYAIMSQKQHVEMYTLGAELINMTSDNINSSNTSNWRNLIANVRSLYSGKVTYDGNWGGGTWNDELDHIKFWDALDYIGVSAYYHIGGTNINNYTQATLEAAWDNVRTSQLEPLHNKYGKSIIFTEVGYRNVDGALTHPASWEMSGGLDEQEQSDGYESLFSYWGNISYFAGVQFWDWKSNPNAGGANDSDFTPQNKLAQATIKTWFRDGGNSAETPDPNQPKVNYYLSDMTYDSAINGWGPVEKDESNGEQQPFDGKTITINGQTYDKGLGTNAKSKIIYSIKNCTQFISDIGVDDEVTTKGSVVFQVWSGPTKIYDSGLMTYADPAKHLNLSITGTTSLALIVNDGGNGNGKDHADWAAATITCFAPSDPTPTPSPVPSPSPAPTPVPSPNPPPPTAQNIEIWWPSDGSSFSGTNPFKVAIPGANMSNYTMYWQVDGDRLNPMFDATDHKEAWVDVSGWTWRGNGPYKINFVAKNTLENIFSQKEITIYISR